MNFKEFGEVQGRLAQEVEKEIKPDLAVLDGYAETAQAFQVLVNPFHLTANEFIVLDRKEQGQQFVNSLPIGLSLAKIEGQGILFEAVVGAWPEGAGFRRFKIFHQVLSSKFSSERS